MRDSFTVNEIQLTYKRLKPPIEMPQVKDAESAYNILYSQWDENRIDLVEDFKVLLLNRALKVIGIYHASSGTTNGAIVDTKLIFVAALKSNADSIILAHNHPSGNLKPSEQDKKLTARLKTAGEILGITVNDHIIITSEGFHSFTNEMAYRKTERDGFTYFECLQPF